ncbi:hypothetical protein ANN_21494 [Periplaneta americana]|uniref:Uncharacterized protein n=1 Tax=Periplaneta americana TaxID=6978 RepID=A0ABQ8SHB6_PERAM|nr:hypothetical protein ANN_21494 [Periplaneta americana]
MLAVVKPVFGIENMTNIIRYQMPHDFTYDRLLVNIEVVSEFNRRNISGYRGVVDKVFDISTFMRLYSTEQIEVFKAPPIPRRGDRKINSRSQNVKKNLRWKVLQHNIERNKKEGWRKKRGYTVGETTDTMGRYIANVIVGALEAGNTGEPFLLHCEQVDKANYSTISKLFDQSLRLLWSDGIRNDNMLLLITYAVPVPYIVKVVNSLRAIFSKMVPVACLAHVLHRAAEELRVNFSEVDKLFSLDGIDDSEMIFGEMRLRIRHRLHDIRLTIGENLGKTSTRTGKIETKATQNNTIFHILLNASGHYTKHQSCRSRCINARYSHDVPSPSQRHHTLFYTLFFYRVPQLWQTVLMFL